ncbi:MAG: hypothetical protein JST86_17405 [Bacteroidetes bacterium]|nr:hypothetical protein [Bacteroidota bacterium]
MLCFFVYGYSRWLFWLLLFAWAGTWAWVYHQSKHKIVFFLSLFSFLLLFWFTINYTPVQNFLVRKVTAVLSENLHTKVEVKHVDFSLFNKMLIEGVMVEDLKKDTLLYAGAAKVNITDWFFIKDKITLQYVGLKDAVVNLNRSDSVWNYQFLVNYFSSPDTSKSGNSNNVALDCKKVELENIRFKQIDGWVGKDMLISIKSFKADIDSISIPKKIASIKNIRIDGAAFAQNDYTGKRPETNSVAETSVTIKPPSPYQWNPGGWLCSVGNIELSNSSFQNDKETDRAPYTDKFDGQHLLFGHINGNLKNVLFYHDTLSANINLSTREKCGFEVKKIEAAMKFTPEKMEFNHLDLETAKSRLGNYYSMSYEGFNESMGDFIHSVTLEGKFDNSHVHSDDIAYFAPELKPWSRSFEIKGTAKGPIDNLIAKNILIKSGATTIDGDIALRGLPNLKNTFIDFKSNMLVTNYNDIVAIIPPLKNITQPQLPRLGNITFKGNFTGFINDFVTYGFITTGLGNVIADINMKLPDNKPPTYSGKISSGGFNLGAFVDNKSLGKVALDGNVVGAGFTLKDLNASFKGNVHRLDFSGYSYSNITLDGTFQQQVFTGHGAVDDPNLKIDNFDGTVSLAGKEAIFDFNADLKKSNFKALGYTLDDFALDGHFALNFTGNDIDKFLGRATVNHATLLHNNTRLSFDSLTLRSYVLNDKKYLSVQSNEMNGSITGNFKILELPDAFKFFLNRYYPAYIEKPSAKLSNQDFSFLINTKEVDEYVQLIDKRLKGFNNSTFSGNLNLATNEMNITADVPQFEYDKKIFNSLHLEGKGNDNVLDTKITTGDVILNDSLHFPGAELSVQSKNDVSTLHLKTSASKTLSQADLNATVQTLKDGVNIHFSPSSFILNDKKWKLEKDGELTIRKAFIDASEVKFTQDNQEITLSTVPAEDGTDNTDIVATLKKVNIDDFAPFFVKKPRLEGILTGTITLKDPFGKPRVEYDALAEKLTVDNKEIGNTTLHGDVNTNTGLITMKASADNPHYKFQVDGTYNYKDSTAKQMDINLAAEHFDISLLDNYLGSVFTNMQGDAVSNLKISGQGDKPKFSGSVTVTGGSLKVIYTQCTYNFGNETILFNPGELDLGTIQLTDTYKNTGTASGKLYFDGMFEDMVFDNMRFETGKMLLLNTTEKDNSDFYGKVIGRARMSLNGPISDMKLKISGEPSILDSSHIFLPTGTSRENSTIDYIDFVQFGKKMEDIQTKQGTNISVDMDITANPACQVDVILDETTGDIIRGNGTGKLNIKAGTRENLDIHGRYDITSGDYKFNFQTFIKRGFTINQGSFLVWNGNPYLANINIDAKYSAKNVDMSSLVSSSGKLTQKSDIDIIAHLTNTLQNPKIDFDFVIPKINENDKNTDPVVLESLKKFKQDENEMNRQVASLLLFNSFISDDNGGLAGSTRSFIYGTVGQVISGFLNNQLTRFFQKVFKDPTLTPYLSFNSNYNLTSKDLINALAASGNFGFKKEYFDGRLIVALGGNIDYNNPYILQARNTNVLLTPDITIEYILTKDKKLRIVGFNRTSVDVTLGQRNRTGVRLSYQKEFDKQPRRKEKPPAIKTNPAPDFN